MSAVRHKHPIFSTRPAGNGPQAAYSEDEKEIVIALRLLCFVYIPKHESKPINNGFSLKFKPISVKEQVRPKSFGSLFAKIPQELPQFLRPSEILSEAIFAHPANLANGCTNQIAKMLYPINISQDSNETKYGQGINFINIPIINQPAQEYNILVATAPKNIKLGKKKDALPTVIYVVFPGDDKLNETSDINLPAIYFVNRDEEKVDTKKEKNEPIFIVDSNRTVTGLKSKAVSKFVRFKNRLTNLYEKDLQHA
ncbi:uncharacterized protein [Battus philenor]|uniref:uncharacterized protein n=1 Tax=Battus philenor TaxID=42288 RepID=UPI0035CE9711